MTDRAYQGAELERRVAGMVRLGVIDSVDVAGGRARVAFDADWTSDDLPWVEGRSGDLRTWSAPTVGEQVVVLSPSGETGAGVILRGLASAAHPSAAADANLSVLAQWADGALEQYDAGGHVRLIQLPAGGRLEVTIAGATVLQLAQDQAVVQIGGAALTLQGGNAILTGAAIQLGAGGAAIARVGDTVSGGKITSGSTVATCG